MLTGKQRAYLFEIKKEDSKIMIDGQDKILRHADFLDLDKMKEKYGKMREIHITLKSSEDMNKLAFAEKFDLLEDDLEIKVEGKKAIVKFNSSKAQVSDAVVVLCGCMPQAFPDKAVAVSEADIEEIIRRLYKG